MRALFSSLSINLLIRGLLLAQAPDIQWQKALGGSNYENANSIIETSDSGFLVIGTTASNDGDITENHGSVDVWLLKLDSLGSLEWQKSYGGTAGEEAFQIQETSDNGFIFIGYSTSSDGDLTANHGGDDVWVVKIDEAGVIEWQKSYGGSSHEIGYSISQNDIGYVLCGMTSSNNGDVSGNHGGQDVWVVQLNLTGDQTWQKCYGGSNDEQAHAIMPYFDGGFGVAGYSYSNDGDVSGNHGATDYWILRIDSEGAIQWSKMFGGTDYDLAQSIEMTPDSGFIVIGYIESNNGDVSGFHGGVYDYWVTKIDSTGNLIWQKCYGGNGTDEGFWIQHTQENGYILAGVSATLDNGDVTGHHGDAGYGDYWLVNIDSVGTINWQLSLGGSLSDAALSIIQTNDGGFCVTGWAASSDGDVTGHHGIILNWDFWVVKLAPPCIETIFYADNDGDGFGDIAYDSTSCEVPIGFVSDSTDCNDTDVLIYPSAIDVCNLIDDNCNGLVDEDATFLTLYLDVDDDGFGDALNDSISCSEVIGYVSDSSDCNDLNAGINPSMIEICNDVDDNCNGDIDEGLIINTFYIDADEDGFGNSDIFINSCLELVSGYVFDSTDCNDANNLIYPGETEICDYLDNDCDGIIDDNLTYIHSYEDADADNYGNIDVDSLSCEIPYGFVEDDSDCDDTNPLIYPGADEILNGIDDNCDELIDEGLGIDGTVSNAIIIYPNPTDNKLYIQWNDNEQGTFHLKNVTGEIIETFNKIFPVTEIEVSKYAAGVYLLETGAESKNAVIKFVKE